MDANQMNPNFFLTLIMECVAFHFLNNHFLKSLGCAEGDFTECLTCEDLDQKNVCIS